MRRTQILALCFIFAFSAYGFGQRVNQGTRSAMDVPDNPQAVGDAGIAWYTTWESGLAEAKRSNRPIFFMSAATTCSGISGVF
jgi:hypothetical protein